MTEPTYRQQMLRYCLRMAKLDPEYAEWAAAWYERNEPWSLEGLAKKVEDTIAEWRQKVAAMQSASSSPSALSAGSTSASTGAREPVA